MAVVEDRLVFLKSKVDELVDEANKYADELNKLIMNTKYLSSATKRDIKYYMMMYTNTEKEISRYRTTISILSNSSTYVNLITSGLN